MGADRPEGAVAQRHRATDLTKSGEPCVAISCSARRSRERGKWCKHTRNSYCTPCSTSGKKYSGSKKGMCTCTRQLLSLCGCYEAPPPATHLSRSAHRRGNGRPASGLPAPPPRTERRVGATAGRRSTSSAERGPSARAPRSHDAVGHAVFSDRCARKDRAREWAVACWHRGPSPLQCMEDARPTIGRRTHGTQTGDFQASRGWGREIAALRCGACARAHALFRRSSVPT